jgi:Virulence-associated protein E
MRTVNLENFQFWAQYSKKCAINDLPDARSREMAAKNIAKTVGGVWTSTYCPTLSAEQKLRHEYYINSVKPANKKKLAAKIKRKSIEATINIADAIMQVAGHNWVCEVDSAKHFQVGINRKIIGKTSPDQLSYPGAFEVSGAFTMRSLADHIRFGHPWMPAILEPNTPRRQENATLTECLALDVDGGWTIEECLDHPIVRKFAGLVITTVSHTPDNHRYRIVFALDRPIENASIIKSCLSALMGFFPAGVDGACKDSSRFFFGAVGAEILLCNELAVFPADLLELCGDKIEQASTAKNVNLKPDIVATIGQDLNFDEKVRAALTFCPIRDIGSGTYDDCRNYIWGLCALVGAEDALALVLEHDPPRQNWNPAAIVEAYQPGKGSNPRHFWKVAVDYGWVSQSPSGQNEILEFYDDLTKAQYIELSKIYEERDYNDNHFWPDDKLTKEGFPDPSAGKPISKDSKRHLDFAYTANGVIRYNKMSNVVELYDRRLDLDHANRLVSNLIRCDMLAPKAASVVGRAAMAHAYHPVLDYLESIKEGEISLDLIKNFALNFWGNDDPIDNQIIYKKLIAGVARIKSPGVQDDLLPILHGKAGMGKSTLIRSLAGGRYLEGGQRFESWFSDQLTMSENKDNLMILNKAWHHELPEIDDQGSKASIQHTKKFVSSTADTFRLPYTRDSKDYPRSCTLWGTTNNPDMLNDPGYDRRFCMVAVNSRVDIAQIKANRDLIWRSALAAHESGERHYFTADEEQDMIERNRDYLKSNGTIDDVIWDVVYAAIYNAPGRAAINNGGELMFSMAEVIAQLSTGHQYDALLKMMGGYAENKIGKSLRSIGFEPKRRFYQDTARKKVWVAEEKTSEIILAMRARKLSEV